MAGDAPAQAYGSGANASFITTDLVGVAISLPIVATLATILRIYAGRLKGHKGLRADCWFLIITLVVSWGHSINTLVCGGIGGIDTITIPPREYANVALRTLWISSFFLITALYTIKISILIFYYHLFSVKTWFRRAVIAMSIVLTLWWLSSIILAFCSTVPFSAAWTDAATARHRYDFNTWYISYSGLSIFFDIVILCFPVPMIRSLHNVSTSRKLSILAIFWLGGFVCVSATVRFVLLYNSIYKVKDFGGNQYSEYTKAFIWAEVEPNTSIVAACLPALGPLLREVGWIKSLVQSVRGTILGRSSAVPSAERVTPSADSKKRRGFVELSEDVEMREHTNSSMGDTKTKQGNTQTTVDDLEAGEGLEYSRRGYV